MKNGKLIRSFGDDSSSIRLLHVNDDGKIIIAVVEEYNSSFDREEKLKIWNIKTGQEHIVEKTRNEKDWGESSFSVINSDLTQNLLFTKRNSELEVRQLNTGKLISVTDFSCESDSSKIILDGKLFVNINNRNTQDGNYLSVEVCNLTNGERVHSLYKQAKSLNVEFSPDSKILAISESDSQNKTIELYNLKTGKIDQSFIDAPNSILLSQTLAFTPDGRFLLTGSDNGMRIWRIR